MNYTAQIVTVDYWSTAESHQSQFAGFAKMSFTITGFIFLGQDDKPQSVQDRIRDASQCEMDVEKDIAKRMKALDKLFAYQYKPSAGSVVSFGLGFGIGAIVGKNPGSGVVGGAILGGAYALGKDIIADNTVRTARWLYRTRNLQAERSQRKTKCFTDRGLTPPPMSP